MRTRLFVGVLSIVAAAILSGVAAGAAAPDTAAVCKAIEPSLATVSIYLKYDAGDAPSGAATVDSEENPGWRYSYGQSALVDRGEPVRTIGFLVDKDLVLTDDLMIPDRFVSKVEVEVNGATYPARADRYCLLNRGIFYRLDRPVTAAKPVVFNARLKGPYAAVTVVPGRDGRMNIRVTPLAENQHIGVNGRRFTSSPAPALIVNAKAAVVAAALSTRLYPEGDWKGSPLLWPTITAGDYAAKGEEIKKAAEAGLLQVTINLRTTQSRRRMDAYSAEDSATPSEIQAVGLLLRPGTVLVLANLSRRDTARIETITLVRGDKNVPLKVEGALARFGALVASYDGTVEGAAAVPQFDGDLAGIIDALGFADQLSYDKDAREERLQRERLGGLYDGTSGLLWPYMATGSQGVFLFTRDGKLAAIPIEARSPIQMQAETRYYGRGYSQQETLSMPVGRLASILADKESLDATQKPLSEEDSKRIAWLGIETQDVTRDLARAKNASLVTKGGEVGALVTYVYKGSPAEQAGVQTGDILVRFVIPGQAKPVDVRMYEERDFEFPWAQLDQVPDIYFEQLPRPWPSQLNAVTKVLTEVGTGRTVTAVFARDGQLRDVDFTLALGPRDFNSAPTAKDGASGLTAKDITFEVRNYFKMKDADSGVVVAEIEPGSKASVAGVKPCEVITAINGAPMKSVEDFTRAMSAGGDLALTVKRMSQSRVAKISLPSTAPKSAAASAESKPAAPAVSTEPELAPPASVPQAPSTDSTASAAPAAGDPPGDESGSKTPEPVPAAPVEEAK